MRYLLILSILALLVAGCGTAKINPTAPPGATAGARGRAIRAPSGKPNAPSDLQSKASFVCIMCPGTASPKPGACPVCGRILLPRKVKENLAKNPSKAPKIEFDVTITPHHAPAASASDTPSK